MKLKIPVVLSLLGLFPACFTPNAPAAATAPPDPAGWYNWRGPNQNGTSPEKNLPDTLDASKPLWTADFPGLSTAVAANGKIYIMGYLGEGPDLSEGVACFDAETGKKLWEKLYLDFLSDTIYLRYATSSPTIDPETGDVYIQDTQGIFAGFTADGQLLWEHSLMEEYGRLTFPNGRTASPVVDGDLVITRGITANWGSQGPAADRFYAFDKLTGEAVWASTPGGRPKDNSYSHPILAWLDGRRVFYSATGDGSIVCVNACNGNPIFQIPIFRAGINSSLLLHSNSEIIAIYGTPYEPGQMVGLKIPHVTPTNAALPVVVEPSHVVAWSNEIRTSTSSPILVGDRVYVTSEVGYLVAVDALTGKIYWKLKLGIEQRNSSPLYADGKIYAPMLNDPGVSAEVGEEGAKGGHGAFYIIKPGDNEGTILSHIVLDGRCYGTPTAYHGHIYIQTTQKLYCFGNAASVDAQTAVVTGGTATLTVVPNTNNGSIFYQWQVNGVPVGGAPAPGPAHELQVRPSELLMQPGDTASFHVRALDANGLPTGQNEDPKSVHWASFIPPTAKVKAAMKASFNEDGQLVAAPDKVASAGAFMASADNIKGFIRGRVLPGLPIHEDFEKFNLTETTTDPYEPPTQFAYPPLPWIGARFKFDVREKDGTKCLVKTVDNPFFQRATVFMGLPDLKNYTIEADVMSDGNKRKMSTVGVINQRYRVSLKGNEQVMEITSNEELLNERVPFHWLPNVWYRLEARVDVAPDGSGVIRGKAWKRGDPEPSNWVIEKSVTHANLNGCPGLFAFSPQNMRVYIDNIDVTAN